ncbi:MAG: hypothetical protein JNK87_32605 [Bryobacterales bacterium]|nr:hypothetical protein [Bryobacterales bacterium]
MPEEAAAFERQLVERFDALVVDHHSSDGAPRVAPSILKGYRRLAEGCLPELDGVCSLRQTCRGV